MAENNTCGNGSGCGCSGTTKANQETRSANKAAQRQIDIEFLYLDLETCEPCKGTENGIEGALADISDLLSQTGVGVNLKKIQVESFEQALELGFISSPTIRVAGRDVSLEVKENYCASCSEISGEETYCRIYNFQGEEFSAIPKSLVIEAVLKEIYGAPQVDSAVVSSEQSTKSLDNLKLFFEGRKRRNNDAAAKNNIASEQPILPQQTVHTANSAGCGCS